MRFRTALITVTLLAASPALAQTADHAQHTAAATQGRFVLLEGGRNFRDDGGYKTTDGKTVKSGIFYRSGSLGSLTPQGQQQLRALKVRSIIDLRSTPERKSDTNTSLTSSGHGYWTRDYDMPMGNLSAMFGDRTSLTADKVRAAMTTGYRSIFKEQAPSYRELFSRLIAGKGPVVVNCTAGKDRTGVASALVLTALGVPYSAVREDFLLSNGAPGMDGLARQMAALPADVAAPLVGVEGQYLDAAFDQINKDYGSVKGFLAKELGVGPQQIAQLRRRMLK